MTTRRSSRRARMNARAPNAAASAKRPSAWAAIAPSNSNVASATGMLADRASSTASSAWWAAWPKCPIVRPDRTDWPSSERVTRGSFSFDASHTAAWRSAASCDVSVIGSTASTRRRSWKPRSMTSSAGATWGSAITAACTLSSIPSSSLRSPRSAACIESASVNSAAPSASPASNSRPAAPKVTPTATDRRIPR